MLTSSFSFFCWKFYSKWSVAMCHWVWVTSMHLIVNMKIMESSEVPAKPSSHIASSSSYQLSFLQSCLISHKAFSDKYRYAPHTKQKLSKASSPTLAHTQGLNQELLDEFTHTHKCTCRHIHSTL